MASNKDLKQLVQALRAQGFVVEHTKGQHLKVTHPDRSGVVFMSGTPSDHRGLKNAVSHLKRMGFKP